MQAHLQGQNISNSQELELQNIQQNVQMLINDESNKQRELATNTHSANTQSNQDNGNENLQKENKELIFTILYLKSKNDEQM